MREILFQGKRMDNGEWVTGAWLPVTNTIMYEKGLGMDCFDELHTVCSSREVVGNIHDNPEPLEVSE